MGQLFAKFSQITAKSNLFGALKSIPPIRFCVEYPRTLLLLGVKKVNTRSQNKKFDGFPVMVAVTFHVPVAFGTKP